MKTGKLSSLGGKLIPSVLDCLSLFFIKRKKKRKKEKKKEKEAKSAEPGEEELGDSQGDRAWPCAIGPRLTRRRVPGPRGPRTLASAPPGSHGERELRRFPGVTAAGMCTGLGPAGFRAAASFPIVASPTPRTGQPSGSEPSPTFRAGAKRSQLERCSGVAAPLRERGSSAWRPTAGRAAVPWSATSLRKLELRGHAAQPHTA